MPEMFAGRARRDGFAEGVTVGVGELVDAGDAVAAGEAVGAGELVLGGEAVRRGSASQATTIRHAIRAAVATRMTPRRSGTGEVPAPNLLHEHERARFERPTSATARKLAS